MIVNNPVWIPKEKWRLFSWLEFLATQVILIASEMVACWKWEHISWHLLKNKLPSASLFWVQITQNFSKRNGATKNNAISRGNISRSGRWEAGGLLFSNACVGVNKGRSFLFGTVWRRCYCLIYLYIYKYLYYVVKGDIVSGIKKYILQLIEVLWWKMIKSIVV